MYQGGPPHFRPPFPGQSVSQSASSAPYPAYPAYPGQSASQSSSAPFPAYPAYPGQSACPPIYPYSPSPVQSTQNDALLKEKFHSCLSELGVKSYWNWNRFEPRIR